MKLFKTIIYASYIFVVLTSPPIIVGMMGNGGKSVTLESFQRLLFVTSFTPLSLAIIAGYYKLPFKTFFSIEALMVVVYVLVDVISVVVGFKVHNSQILETAILMTGGMVWFTLSYVIVSMIIAYSFLWVIYMGALLYNTPLKPRS
ncbi:MAG: hypothetical protein KBB86_01410 [Candidatus Pacebacteria bacterium]|nr:hypothetical protein [Candidatus Paceibacterota bacterium]